LTWYRKLGRTVFAVYPFVLVVALILVGAFFLNFTTEQTWSDLGYENVITLHPNQTIIHNVTMSYEVHEPNRGYGSRMENGSIVIEEPPFTNTLTWWKRAWLPFTIELNDTGDIRAELNRTLVGPQGIIEPEGHMYFGTNEVFTIADPEVTQGGTYRLSLQNMGSEDIHPKLSWQLKWHYYEKPYFYYGIAGLLIALVYPAMLLIRGFGNQRQRQQSGEEKEATVS